MGFSWAVATELSQDALIVQAPAWLAFGAAMSLFVQLGETARVLLLTRLGKAHWLASQRISFMANLLSLLPLGWVGGDLYRTHKLSSFAANAGEALGGVAIARLLGLIATTALFAIASFAILTDPPEIAFNVSGLQRPLGIGLTLLVLATAVLLFLPRVRRPLMARVQKLLSQTSTAVGDIRLPALLLAGLVSLGVALGRGLLLWSVALTLGEQVSLPIALAASGVGLVISVVPFTSAGIGLREAAIAAALAALGPPLTAAILIASGTRLLAASVSLVGWAGLAILERRTGKSHPAGEGS
ncbi:lysylphosphatidylglycerol synthase domain-containing protein [Maricaulis sp.]|uniref:lysylphosphatidylglycerol synthase domain-containing protein n=1 Tax=Maricaulis sp. TaxID=1486257 RepID=UPI001AFE314E|nr:lysylphosphatidylglycerol synthase domain-containing protein [Maricaulis sp.]MBO6797756.1 flippase-like domain-containing protein [Maricaulis sp.]